MHRGLLNKKWFVVHRSMKKDPIILCYNVKPSTKHRILEAVRLFGQHVAGNMTQTKHIILHSITLRHNLLVLDRLHEWRED